MKKTEAFIITLLFALFLAVPLVLTLVLPKSEFSEWENRPLATFPEVSVDSVLSGEFGKDFETYLADYMVWREGFVKLKRGVNSALGMREENGIIIGDKALFRGRRV